MPLSAQSRGRSGGFVYGNNFRAPKVDVHKFSMIPRADIPRSSFVMEHQHKTTISASNLVPVYLQEILPGDTFNVEMSVFARLATPLFPIMDNMQIESFFFFVPNRLVWIHWANFMGEQTNPGDSISYSIPTVTSPVGGFSRESVYDYFGLPCVNQTAGGNTITISALPLRAYNLIYKEWFRDQNLTNSPLFGSGASAPPQVFCAMDDGPDPSTNYVLRPTARRHDYFAACLPWTQKGGVPVSLPLVGSATVRTSSTDFVTGVQNPMVVINQDGTQPIGHTAGFLTVTSPGSVIGTTSTASGTVTQGVYPSNLYADLSTSTGTQINAIRLAFQTQRLLERDARGGTRYTEIVRSHFGVMSPDMRLMRPEYLGGGKSPVNISPVPQTTATGVTGSTSPLGTLAAVGTGVARHGFRQSFTEHGHVVGVVCIRKDNVYQQGIRRLWSRSTRYDFYFPVFAALGEQAVLNKEIYSDGSANDAATFGFQERWAEYRYHPSFTSAFFNSMNSTPLDAWHLATKFSALPVLNDSFIEDDTVTILERCLASGASSLGQQFLCDFFFSEKAARPMPLYSVPGLIDHF